MDMCSGRIQELWVQAKVFSEIINCFDSQNYS